MIRHTLIDLNLVDFNYYRFMISLDKRNRSCNVVDDSSMIHLCVPSKTKDLKYENYDFIKCRGYCVNTFWW